MKKRYIFLIIAIFLFAYIMYGNSALEVNEIRAESEKLPVDFDGFRIAQISDLHNKAFGKENRRLIEKIENAGVDIIVITGDFVNSGDKDVSVAMNLAEKLVGIAPTYYINGNNEAGLDDYEEFIESLENLGVVVLEDSYELIEKGESRIFLMGAKDLNYFAMEGRPPEEVIETQLSDFAPEEEGYKLLLAHRPEYFGIYAKYAELTLSGHVHGGQFILPYVGGLLDPGRCFFPEYYSGLYEENGKKLIVSRGLGNSFIPIRINNKPEIVIVELEVQS